MTVKIYTDGACSGNPGVGGWAAVFALKDDIKVISGNEPNTTNNRMELLAAIKAIEIAEKRKVEKAVIYSDSSYVVNAITCGWLNLWKSKNWVNAKKEQVKNKDLWEYLDKLFRCVSVKVTFMKVKGHKGDPLNEIADKRAKEEVLKAKAKKGI